MNEEIYNLALKQLGELDVNNLMDVELRHVEAQRDEDGIQENHIQIDIYYNVPYAFKDM